MNTEEFYQWVVNMMGAFPNDADKRNQIKELYYLALSEIEEGGSEWNEINHAINSIDELIGDADETQVGWDVAKNHVHDISGIVNHEEYWYKKENGIYYPQLRKS
jgi:hypothetical protein